MVEGVEEKRERERKGEDCKVKKLRKAPK